MKNWKRILAAAGTAALLVSNLGAVSQVVFADDNIGFVDVADEENSSADPAQVETPAEPEAQAEESVQTPAAETPSEPAAPAPETSETPETTESAAQPETNPGTPADTASENPADGTTEDTSDEESNEDAADETPDDELDEKPTDEEPAEEEETEVEYDYYDNDSAANGLKVTARAEKGTIAEGYDLKVDVIENRSELSDIEDALNESSAVEEFTDFLAYDIYFANADGDRTEPEEGKVQVSFEFDAGTLPAAIDPDSIAVQHFDESGDTTQIVPVADTTDDSVKTETPPAEDVAPAVTAEFEVGSFSTFTITWKDGNTTYFDVTVHYVDESGKEIDGFQSERVYVNRNSVDLSFDSYATLDAAISNNYSYIGAHYGSYDGRIVTSMEAEESSYWFFGTHYTRELIFKNGDSDVRTLTYDNRTVTADVYLVFKAKNTGTQEQTKELSNSKTVVKNDDGTYDLTLSVSGAVGSQTDPLNIGILLVIDTSGSMKDGMGNGQTRLQAVRSAVSQLTTTLGNNDKVNAEYSIITFSGTKGWGSTGDDCVSNDLGWTADTTQVSRTMNSLSANGGTNYEAALYAAKELLNSDTTKAKNYDQTVLIFLTDGEPTYRGAGNNGVEGTGNSDNNGLNLAAAVRQASDINSTSFYIIGAGSNMSTTSTTYQNLAQITNAATNVDAKNKGTYSATSTTELNNAFEKIAGNITAILTDHVVMTDPLSSYVALTSGAKVSVVVTDKDGNPVGQQNADGSVTLPETENNQQTTLRATYDAATKTIKSDFPSNYQLEPDYTYSIKTTIEPTEDAYEIYRENGGEYPSDGDGNTGSYAGQGGFYSNGDATIDYNYNEEPQPTVRFDKPVIQLEPGTLTITKSFEGLTAEQISALRDTLTFNVSLTWTTAGGAAETNENDANLPATITLGQFSTTDGIHYTYTYSKGLTPGTSYTITESGTDVENYELETTSVTTATGTVGKNASVTAALTNKYTASVGALKITKTVGTANKEYVDADAEYEIKVFIKDASGNALSGTFATADGTAVTFTDGYAYIKVKDGASVEIQNLPKDAAYEINETESSADNFNVTYSGKTGKIVAKETVEATVTNTSKIVKTGVNINSDIFQSAVVAIDAAVLMFLLFGFVKRRLY